MGAAFQGVEQGWFVCPYLGDNLRGSGSVGSVVWVIYMGDDTTYWEDSGRIPPQGGPQADGMTTLAREGR